MTQAAPFPFTFFVVEFSNKYFGAIYSGRMRRQNREQCDTNWVEVGPSEKELAISSNFSEINSFWLAINYGVETR